MKKLMGLRPNTQTTVDTVSIGGREQFNTLHSVWRPQRIA